MNQRHTVVVDLGYGDAGKGSIVDWLCAEQPVTAVVRFNGGAQAAHNVVTPSLGDVPGRHHTFSQFGSGTLHGVPTHLSRYMIVDPLALPAEADHLRRLGVPDPLALLSIDETALLCTPWHRAANRRREMRRAADRHGSCGMGVGETAAFALAFAHDAPRAGDTRRPAVLARKLAAVRDVLQEELGPLDVAPLADVAEAMLAFGRAVRLAGTGPVLKGRCVFEGAQGVLLDEWRGWHPFTTWSTTTFDNAEQLLAEAGQPGEALRLGVVRSYTTRHGAGPLVTFNAALTEALPEPHNRHGAWQGAWRAGHFDAVAHRYAIEVAGGVDALAVTHLDVARRHRLRMCLSYRDFGPLTPGELGDLAYQEKLTGRLLEAEPVYSDFTDPGEVLGAPVMVRSYGPTYLDKTRCR